MHDQQQSLIEDIDNAIEFRERKCAEFPDDSRNAESVAALKALRKHVESMSPSDALFLTLQLRFDDCQQSEFAAAYVEFIHPKLSRLGFDAGNEPKAFIEEVKDWIAERAEASHLPSATVH
jgi:hypothetical protein